MNRGENNTQTLSTTSNSRSSRTKASNVDQKSSSAHLVRLLVSSDFSNLPSASCHDSIKSFLHLQKLLITLSSVTALDDFYQQVENGISSIFQASKAFLWIPFPSQQLLVRPTNYQTKSIPQKYKSSMDGSTCSVILKENGECLGILNVECNSDIPESDFILISYFAKNAAILLRKLNDTPSNVQNVFLKALNVITARNSDQLKNQCDSLKSLLKCDYLEPFLVNDDSMTPLFEKNNSKNKNEYKSYREKVLNGELFISNEMIICPLMNSKRKVSFSLVAKKKHDNFPFNYQDQLIMSIFSPIIQFSIQNLTSLDKKRKYINVLNNILSLSDTIEQMADSPDCQKPIGDLVNTACDVFNVEYGALFLLEKEYSKLNCCITVGFSERIIANPTDKPFSECISERSPVLNGAELNFGSIIAKTYMALPIFSRKEEIKGILLLMNKSSGTFSSSDVKIGKLFSSLCGCAFSVSKTEVLKLFNRLIKDEFKSEQFLDAAEKISGIKTIQIVRVQTDYPINYTNPCEYINFSNSDDNQISQKDNNKNSTFSHFQKKFCNYFSNLTSIRAENNALKRMTSYEFIIREYMTSEEESLEGVPAKLKVNSGERTRYSDLNLYTADLDDLHQFKLLFFIFNEMKLFTEFHITAHQLFSFLFTVRSKYQDNPYHNWFHALDVLQFNFVISRLSELHKKLHPIEQLALYLSLISHDIGHVGFSNNFLKQSKMPLSMLYDRSILETFHLSNMIQIMTMPGHNLIESASQEDIMMFWETSIHIILMTDMERHKEFMNTWQSTIERGLDWNNKEDRITVLSMFMKLSDISNCARPFKIAEEWAKKILDENFNQGDKEIQLGFGYSAPLTNRHEQTLPKSQIGFYSFICIPAFQKLVEYFPKLQILMDNINSNLNKWKQLDENNKNSV